GNPKPAGTMSWTVTGPTGASVSCANAAPTDVSASNGGIPTTSYACSFPAITAGTYHATANFPGDVNYNSVNSSIVPIVVATVTPTLSVIGAQSTTVAGQIITYTATVTGTTGSVAPTGAPTWTLTGPSGNSCTTPTTTTSGVATIYTCIVPAAIVGTYSAAISVALDSNYNAAGPSTPATLTVSQFAPTVAVTTSPPTTTLGTGFSFTATVTGPTGGVTPTGSGSWQIVGVTGINCSNGAASGNPTGTTNVVTYTCAITASVAGTYVPVFTFNANNADTNYLATAPTSGYTTSVAKALPTLSVTAAASSAALGSAITFNASVTGPTSATTPSALGTWIITGVSGITSCTTTSGPTGTLNVASYSCSVNATTAGTYGATFSFAGDSSYNAVGATSSSTQTAVTQVTPTVAISTSSTPTLGGSLLYSATVTGVSGALAPTGVMSFNITGNPTPVSSCSSTTGASTTGVVTTYTCTVATPHAG